MVDGKIFKIPGVTPEDIEQKQGSHNIGDPAPYLSDIEVNTSPKSNLSDSIQQDVDLASFGLENMEEYELMVDVKAQGGSAQDFREILAQIRSDRQQQTEELPEVDKGTLSTIGETLISAPIDIGKTALDVTGGAITAAPQIVGNVSGFLVDVFDLVTPDIVEDNSKWDLGNLADHLRQEGAGDTKTLREATGVDPDKFTTKVGEFGAELFGTGVLGKLAKLGKVGALGKTILNNPIVGPILKSMKDFGPQFANRFPGAAKTIAPILRSAGIGATDMAKFGIVSEGEPGEVLKSAALGAVSQPLIKGFSKGLKTVGEKLYDSAFRPTVQEANRIFNELVGRSSKKAITRAKTAFEKNIAGTKTGIGVKAVKEADNLWKNSIQPDLNASKSVINKSNLFKRLKETVTKTTDPGRRKELMKGYNKLVEEWKGTNIKNIKDWQKVKSSIDKFTPNKSFKGEEIGPSYREIKARFSNLIRGDIHDKISTEFGVNNANRYLEWANLNALKDLGIQGILTGGENALLTPGGTGTLISNAYTSLMTPVKTFGGLTLYNVGDLFQVVGKTGLKGFNEYLNSISK